MTRLLNPHRWFRIVLGIGAVQATLVGLSLACWALNQAPPTKPLADEAMVVIMGAAPLSVLVPFLAYAGDSRTLLQRYPCDQAALWQAIGGLIGMSTALMGLHLFLILAAARSYRIEAEAWLLVYALFFPPLIVGGLGAAVGSGLAIMANTMLINRRRR